MNLKQLYQSVSGLLPSASRVQRPVPMYAARHLAYVRFKVADEDVAQQLGAWHADDKTARMAIENYLNETFPAARCATGIFYRVAGDGYLKDVAYNGYVPQGWHTQADEDHDRTYHWVEPECSQVMRTITQLPRVPSRRAPADIVGWPYFEVSDQTESAAMLRQSVNHTLRVESRGGDVFLDVPLCDNFNAHPDIKDAVAAWRVPCYLQPQTLLSPPRGLRRKVLEIGLPAVF